jgi:hypothetical protein
MKQRRNLALLLLLVGIAMANCTSGTKSTINQVDSLTTIKSDTSRSTASVDTQVTKTPVATPHQDWLLVPGIAVGKMRVNENAAQAFKVLGVADGGDAAMGKSVAIWYNNHDSTANSVAIYTVRDTGDAPISLIKQIRVTSPIFKTENGVHPGSTLAEIKEAFDVSQTETYKDEGQMYTVYSSNKGIAFEMNSSEKCVAVVVFQSGKPLPGTYLKFRTTNKFLKTS